MYKNNFAEMRLRCEKRNKKIKLYDQRKREQFYIYGISISIIIVLEML